LVFAKHTLFFEIEKKKFFPPIFFFENCFRKYEKTVESGTLTLEKLVRSKIDFFGLSYRMELA
jgi:hypothetical protein